MKTELPTTEGRAICPHGHPLADNTCGPCSKGRPMRTATEQHRHQGFYQSQQPPVPAMHVDHEWSERQLQRPEVGEEP